MKLFKKIGVFRKHTEHPCASSGLSPSPPTVGAKWHKWRVLVFTGLALVSQNQNFLHQQVSKEWVKTRNLLQKPCRIYLFISSWTMNFIFGVCYIDRLLPVFFWGLLQVHDNYCSLFPGKIFLKRKLLFFLRKISERHWIRKVKTTVNTVFIENTWIEPGRRPFIKDLGHAGAWRGIPGSLLAGPSRSPCCHARLLLMRAAPYAFVLWEVNFPCLTSPDFQVVKGRAGIALSCFFFFPIMIRFAKEIRQRQKECLQIGS